MKRTISVLFISFIAIFVAAQTDIVPPELVSPADGKLHQMPDVLMDWNAVSGIGQVSYELQVDTSDQFPDPHIFETTTTSQPASELYFGTTYYWRVRATDDLGTSDWSEVFSYNTFDEVLLQSPGDGDEGEMPNVELKWKKQASQGVIISGITHYTFQISLDTLFTDPVMTKSVNFNSFATTEPFHYGNASMLHFDTEYFWRVSARHALDTTEWSEVRSFTTLVMPELSSPEDNATEQMLDVPLEWGLITGVFGYMYEVSKDPNFTLPAMTVVDTNIVIPELLEFGETYYWRVLTFHNADTSDWSDAWSFETINTVYPTAPANGEVTEDLIPRLEWEPITGISRYHVQYDMDENFSDPVSNSVAPENSFFQIQFILEEETTYYWRVRASQDGDTTMWSETWSFITKSSSGINDLVLTKDNISIFPNPTSGRLTIEMDEPMETLEINLHDLLGKSVFSRTVQFNNGVATKTLDLSTLKEGMYIIRIINGGQSYSEKIIIDR